MLNHDDMAFAFLVEVELSLLFSISSKGDLNVIWINDEQSMANHWD